MTIDECRDRIAGIVGWKNRPDTIDGIVEIWPAGWCFEVCRNEFGVAAQARRNGEPWCVGITEGRNCNTEYEARLRLLLAVLEPGAEDEPISTTPRREVYPLSGPVREVTLPPLDDDEAEPCCPVGDPSCVSGDDECHDACEAIAVDAEEEEEAGNSPESPDGPPDDSIAALADRVCELLDAATRDGSLLYGDRLPSQLSEALDEWRDAQ